MEFTNVLFLFLVLPLFLITYNFVPKNFKNFIILTFSFLILIWKSLILFFVMLGCSFLNYFAASLIKKEKKKKAKMFLIFFSILVNFAICFIVIFKGEFYYYSNFFRGNIFKNLYIYIFFMNSMSYLIDIYKKRVNFSRNVLDYFFIDFLKSISLRKAEIEYRDMIDYVDKVLKPHIDD